MKREGVAAGLTVLSTAGFATLFLPALDKVWDQAPGCDPPTRHQLHTGTRLYLGFVLAIGLGTSYVHKTLFPLFVAGGLAGVVLWTYRRAYAYAPPTPAEAFQR